MLKVIILSGLRLGKAALFNLQSWYSRKLITEYNQTFAKRESQYDREKEFKRIANEAYRASIAAAVKRRQNAVHKINDRSREISNTLHELSEL